MQKLLSIRGAGNTMIPALLALEVKGYTLSIWFTTDGDGTLIPQYDAEKDRRAFSATQPEELLGLVAMWEVRGDDWRLKKGKSALFYRLVEEASVFDSDGNLVEK